VRIPRRQPNTGVELSVATAAPHPGFRPAPVTELFCPMEPPQSPAPGLAFHWDGGGEHVRARIVL